MPIAQNLCNNHNEFADKCWISTRQCFVGKQGEWSSSLIFGQFLGSATVQYKRAEDAKRAKEDYHGGTLDDRVLIVEYDIVKGTISADE